eukprot:Nk52_evm38s236 gene=Nk52_evmTU38s236
MDGLEESKGDGSGGGTGEAVFQAMVVTTISGLSTGIGGLLVVAFESPSKTTIGFLEAFSAGVMVVLSVVDLLWPAYEVIGGSTTILSFALGGIIFLGISHCVPDPAEEGWLRDIFTYSPSESRAKVLRLGLVISLGISIHNFPEGLSVYFASLKGLDVGLPLAVAVAIHNIPEGITVAAPIYHATFSRTKALGLCLISGMFEPLGAIAAYYVLQPWMTEYRLQALLALVAGIMTLISFKELLPSAISNGGQRRATVGFVIGGIVCLMGLIFIPVAV